jgi:predicted nucleotidyltransferase
MTSCALPLGALCSPTARLKYPGDSAHCAHAMIDRTRILKYAQAVAREFHPERIILFGSYAYGTPTEDSDVDLLVVMPHEGHPAYQAAEIELKVPAGFPLDLMVRSPERIRDRLATGDRFVREILHRGSPLYESGNGEVG